MNDAEAVIGMVDANLQRVVVLPSEKAFAIRVKYDGSRARGAVNLKYYGTYYVRETKPPKGYQLYDHTFVVDSQAGGGYHMTMEEMKAVDVRTVDPETLVDVTKISLYADRFNRFIKT